MSPCRMGASRTHRPAANRVGGGHGDQQAAGGTGRAIHMERRRGRQPRVTARENPLQAARSAVRGASASAQASAKRGACRAAITAQHSKLFPRGYRVPSRCSLSMNGNLISPTGINSVDQFHRHYSSYSVKYSCGAVCSTLRSSLRCNVSGLEMRWTVAKTQGTPADMHLRAALREKSCFFDLRPAPPIVLHFPTPPSRCVAHSTGWRPAAPFATRAPSHCKLSCVTSSHQATSSGDRCGARANRTKHRGGQYWARSPSS